MIRRPLSKPDDGIAAETGTTSSVPIDVPFDYAVPADLFFPVAIGRRGGLDYRRFSSAAEALAFAMESLAPGRQIAAVLEIEGQRYDPSAIRQLYEDAAYPLTRQPASPTPDAATPPTFLSGSFALTQDQARTVLDQAGVDSPAATATRRRKLSDGGSR